MIMKISRVVHIVLLLLISFWSSAQDDNMDSRWNQIQDRIDYEQSRRPKGPDGYYIDPPYFEKGSFYKEDAINPDDVSYEDIQYSREKRFPSGTGNNGVRQRIRKGEGVTFEDIDRPNVSTPDIKSPKWDAPDYDPGSFNTGFWKTFLIIFAIVLLAVLIYFIFVKNKDTDTVVKKELNDHEDWDPTEVEMDELTKKLSEAIEKNDYRGCVRIYYTMILKELINKQWIRWEKKKTNLHYLLELGGRKERGELEKSIRIFELVWYGNYNIQKNEYDQLAPQMNAFYQQLKNG
jgi:uncharacterized membrane protein